MSPAPRPTRVMLLETNLDDELDSVRSEIRFLRELLGNFDGIELIAKEVHSRADLEKFLDIARTRRFGTIHIVSQRTGTGAGVGHHLHPRRTGEPAPTREHGAVPRPEGR